MLNLLDNMSSCRLCGAELAPVFRKLLLKKHDVQYFQCTACQAMQTEIPYWLDEAYDPGNERFDSGQVTRSILNAAFLNWLVTVAELSSPRLLDYGCGSGLLVRLLRDSGLNAWGLDRHSNPRLSLGFQVSDPVGFDVINLCEVIEHFDQPRVALDEIFRANPSLVVVQTGIMGEPDPSWFYLADFHGQHIFFLTVATINWIASHYKRYVCIISGYLIFAVEPVALRLIDPNAGALRVEVPNLPFLVSKLFDSMFSQPYRYPLVDLEQAMQSARF
jgi:SAM-dependent methyltransferase